MSSFRFFILCCALFLCFTVKSQENKYGKLFIIGGGQRPSSLIDRIILESEIDKGGFGIILPMSSKEPDTSIYYANRQFIEKGINNIYGLNFSKNQKYPTSKLDSINNAKLIYISGGDQSKFMGIIKNTSIKKRILDAYNNGSVIVGTSAGAAMMCTKMITGKELKHPEYSSTFKHIEDDNIEIKEGLGLLSNLIIDQHFVVRSRYNRLLTAIIEFPNVIGVGIDESTAILVNRDSVEVIGESQVIVMKNKFQSKKNYKNKLGAKDILMNIYLPNDKFNIKNF